MKLIFLIILLNVPVWSQEEICEDDANKMVKSLQVPNCLKENAILQQIQVSNLAETRRENKLSVPSTPGPICGDCREKFSISPADAASKKVKQDAFFETASKELKKAMSELAFDITGLRSNWSLNSNFQNSLAACNTKKIETALKSCGSPYAQKFKDMKLSNLIGGEIASLIASNRNSLNGILSRPDSLISCSIPDIASSNLRQYLFEEKLTPDLIKKIVSIEATTTLELQSRLGRILGQEVGQLITGHPVLRNLLQDPALFKSAFQRIDLTGNSKSIINSFRSSIHSPEIGNSIDTSNATKCNNTINSFTSAFCSDGFKSGNVTLGPFLNYKKFLDKNNYPSDESDASTTDVLLANNSFALEFCDSSSSPKTSLGQTITSMNSWMPFSLRSSNLDKYSSEKYEVAFGQLKEQMCKYSGESCSDESDACRLYKKYKEDQNSPEARIARSSDGNLNRVLESLIGDSSTINPKTREVLIAEGILPQPNGQFVERPQIPERQPEYLAGVANGTITPSTGSSTAAPAQANINRQQRNQQSQAQQQLASFQPQQGSTAAPEQLAAATSEDDSEDLRRFQDGMDERLNNAKNAQNGEQPASRNSQSNRRVVSRQNSSDRNGNGISNNSFVPATAAPADVFSNALPSSVPGEANLGPDTSRGGLANSQKNAALAQFEAAKNNPYATAGAGRDPASVDGVQVAGESTVALTISGDIRKNLENVLKGIGTDEAGLRTLIQGRKTFRFELNNSIFDVQFNNGAYTVLPANNSVGRTLQEVFNDSLRIIPERSPATQRNSTLPDLKNAVLN